MAELKKARLMKTTSITRSSGVSGTRWRVVYQTPVVDDREPPQETPTLLSPRLTSSHMSPGMRMLLHWRAQNAFRFRTTRDLAPDEGEAADLTGENQFHLIISERSQSES